MATRSLLTLFLIIANPLTSSARDAWTSSNLLGPKEKPSPYILENAFPYLQLFKNPTDLAFEPSSGRFFVCELANNIYSFENDPDVKSADVFFNAKEIFTERYQLYSIAFHPNYEANRYLYIAYRYGEFANNAAGKQARLKGIRVDRFRSTTSNPPKIIPESKENILSYRHGSHMGGSLKFGPDGYLYISTGDSGPASPPDPINTGQDISDFNAGILRVDVDTPSGDKLYSIPPDNPFVDVEGAAGEVWAFGLRNPWKIAFDPKDGRLWTSDVGWDLWEMVHIIKKGANYGWSMFEGPQKVKTHIEQGPAPITPPIFSHSHVESRSISGGCVYRGKKFPELDGAYIYGDFVTGLVWGLKHDGNEVTWQGELASSPLRIISFGQDDVGEVYVVEHDGTINRLVKRKPVDETYTFPTKLSETGLFRSTKPFRFHKGIYSYEPLAKPWEDNSVVARYVAIPNNGKFGVFKEKPPFRIVIGDYKTPDLTVYVKTRYLEMEKGNPKSRKRIETQIFLEKDLEFYPYTYEWNEEQTDAFLVDAKGKTKTFTIKDKDAPGGFRNQTWQFTSRVECVTCHSARYGFVIGFTKEQLLGQHPTIKNISNQQTFFEEQGLFTEDAIAAEPKYPGLVDPHDTEASLENRARSYLHVNCSMCHRFGGSGATAFELRIGKPSRLKFPIDVAPIQGDFGFKDPKVIASGDPYRSTLLYRMAKTGRAHMPHLGTHLVDEKGILLIRDYIKSIKRKKGEKKNQEITVLRSEQKNHVKSMMANPNANHDGSLKELLSKPSGALMLALAIADGSLKGKIKETSIANGYKHENPNVSDLFERFIPEDKKIEKLGNDINRERLLAEKGNPVDGKAFLLGAQGAVCMSCHTLDGQGSPLRLGPDFNGIGKKYTSAQILEHILEPSKIIHPQFQMHSIEMTDGTIQLGFLIEQTDELVMIHTLAGTNLNIPSENVKSLVPQPGSTMPQGLLASFTPQQAADLISFLSSLK